MNEMDRFFSGLGALLLFIGATYVLLHILAAWF